MFVNSGLGPSTTSKRGLFRSKGRTAMILGEVRSPMIDNLELIGRLRWREKSVILCGMMTGRCLCGAVMFSAEHVETEHHACHCGMCRRWSGGSGFFGASCEGLAFSNLEDLGRFASSEWAERGFCKACGTTLFYFLKPTQRYTMSVGAFDDPSPFQLVREIFIDRKPDGYAFAGDHERWTESETFRRLTPP